MWWQYLIMAIISISAALIAVYVAHRLSGRNEYRKAISSVRDEVADNISTCENNCELIDTDVNALKENKMGGLPYFYLADLCWSTWKSVILLRNSELAGKIGAAYISIPTVNRVLDRIEELKWGPIVALTGVKEHEEEMLNMAKRQMSTILLPRLKGALELLEKETEKGWKR